MTETQAARDGEQDDGSGPSEVITIDRSAESANGAERGNIFNEILQYINERYGEQDVPPNVASLVNLCRREAKQWTSGTDRPPDAEHGDGSGPSEVTKDPNKTLQKRRINNSSPEHTEYESKRQKCDESRSVYKRNVQERDAIKQYNIISNTLEQLHYQIEKYEIITDAQYNDNNLLKFKETEKGYETEFNKIKQRRAQEEKWRENEREQFETEKDKIEEEIQQQKEKYDKEKKLMDKRLEKLINELAQAKRDYDMQKLLKGFQTEKLKVEEEIQKQKEKYDKEKKLTQQRLEKLKNELTQVQSDVENEIKKLYNDLSAAEHHVKQSIEEMKREAGEKEKELIMKIQELNDAVTNRREEHNKIVDDLKFKLREKKKSQVESEIQSLLEIEAKTKEQIERRVQGLEKELARIQEQFV